MSNHKELTQEVISCCFEVHKYFGSGLLEKVYQEAVCCELNEQFIEFEKEVKIPVFYKDQSLGFDYKADIIVENKVLVELKTVSQLEEIHFAQCMNYLKLSGLKVCLIINFGETSVKIRRIVR